MASTWHCNHCPEILPHFNALLAHYKDKHPTHLKRFDIHNKQAKAIVLAYASSPEEICRAEGWNINECIVKDITNAPF